MRCPTCGSVSTQVVYKCRREDCFFSVNKKPELAKEATKTHTLALPSKVKGGG